MIKIKLSHGAVEPTRNTKYYSGLDLCARGIKSIKHDCEYWFIDTFSTMFTLMPGESVLIKTGLQIEMPTPIDMGMCLKIVEAQIRSRSGLALKNGIVVLNSPGTVDNKYTGDIGVILMNVSDEPFDIKEDMKVAQLVFSEVIIPKNLEIVDSLDDSDRSNKGFGSSGV